MAFGKYNTGSALSKSDITNAGQVNELIVVDNSFGSTRGHTVSLGPAFPRDKRNKKPLH